jgi:uncharacterized protein (DUF305 family)
VLASIAADKADDLHLRALSKLMVASQRGESKILAHWWASWFIEPMQICSSLERASMPGLLDAADIAKLGSTETSSFDRLFVDLMTEHHKGAVAMADSQLRHGSDSRLWIMAHAIRHEATGGDSAHARRRRQIRCLPRLSKHVRRPCKPRERGG